MLLVSLLISKAAKLNSVSMEFGSKRAKSESGVVLVGGCFVSSHKIIILYVVAL